MAKTSVSIYINDNSVRLMVSRGKRISRLASSPLSFTLSDIDTREKEAELAENIRQLLKSNKIKGGKIILGLSGLHCLTRPIVLPELPRAMIKEAITREAKRVLPVPLEQLYLSWQVVSISGGKIQAFMVAMPRQIADMVMRIFTQVGCKPYLMDIKPLALARLSREATAVIVDVQSKEFDIVILINGLPQPVRTVAFPEETLKLTEKFTLVAEEVKRTIQFYNSNNPDSRIPSGTTMYLSGEMAMIPELSDSLAAELGFKVALLASPFKVTKQLDASHYLVNVGLALKELLNEAGPLLPNFNTLPEPYQPRQLPMSRLLAVPAAGIAIAIIVLLFLNAQDAAAKINSTQTQVDNNSFLLEKKQNEKKELTSRLADVQQQITASEASYDVFSNALRSLTKTSDTMNADAKAPIDNVVPGLAIANVSYTGSQITINGQAAAEQQVLQYVRNLQATGRFSEITIVSIQVTGGPDDVYTVSYSLSCILDKDRS